jgi:hypothetical protein
VKRDKRSTREKRKAEMHRATIQAEMEKHYSHFTTADVKKAAGYVPRYYLSPDINTEKREP